MWPIVLVCEPVILAMPDRFLRVQCACQEYVLGRITLLCPLRRLLCPKPLLGQERHTIVSIYPLRAGALRTSSGAPGDAASVVGGRPCLADHARSWQSAPGECPWYQSQRPCTGLRSRLSNASALCGSSLDRTAAYPRCHSTRVPANAIVDQYRKMARRAAPVQFDTCICDSKHLINSIVVVDSQLSGPRSTELMAACRSA